jgi:hypothetical protein
MKKDILIIFFIIFFYSFAVEIDNMPQEKVRDSLYRKNLYREKEKVKIKPLKNSKNSKFHRKSTDLPKSKKQEKIIKTKKRFKEKELKKNKNKEIENTVNYRLIFDYDNIFTLEELKNLHNTLEKLILLKNIDIRIIYNINGRNLNYFESIKKYFLKNRKKFLIISREKTGYSIYSNLNNAKISEIEKIIKMISMEKIQSSYVETQIILKNIEKSFFYNNALRKDFQEAEQQESSFKVELYILVLLIFSIIYIGVSLFLRYFEKIRKRGF